MKKQVKEFLIISFLLSYLSFGGIIYSNTIYTDIFLDPFKTLLFALGFLGPFISSFVVFVLNRDELGGADGFIKSFKLPKSKNIFILILIFLIVHYGSGFILNNIESIGSFLNLFKYLPIMLVLLGSQEIGWRKIVQPSFEKDKGYIKSIIITGLLWSIWFLPLVLIRGFIVLPQFYTQFAGYLIGISFLLTTIYKSSKNILSSIILSTLIFAFAPIIVFKQGFMLMGVAILEIIASSVFKDKKI